ncbi:type II toxin-antitoxin system RelE/ParE family toxin [Rhizobium panacihumi]|uniref:type II toxin-antitoxin system RelE/ParE family toxin n=1 Tax=Rhizobium panacihumi TaxID=2008450 RepID=UPI003D7B3870
MRLKFSVQAEEDLIGIYVYGAVQFGIEQAERYYADLQDTLEMLRQHPRLARERTEFKQPVRVHFHRSHAIVYHADPEDLFVIRVVSGRQDWERLFQED